MDQVMDSKVQGYLNAIDPHVASGFRVCLDRLRAAFGTTVASGEEGAMVNSRAMTQMMYLTMDCMKEHPPNSAGDALQHAQFMIVGWEVSYAIPTQDALNAIMKYGNTMGILEVNAMRGFWGQMLRNFGMRVSMIQSARNPVGATFGPVQQCDVVEYVKANESDFGVLLLVRPDVDKSLETMAIEALQAFKGPYVILISRDYESASAEPGKFKMFSVAEYLETQFELDHHMMIPQWRKGGEYVMFYRRQGVMPDKNQIFTPTHDSTKMK